MGEKQRALAVLQQASMFHGDSRELAGEYGRLALEFDQISVAGRLLAAADDPVKPDWRIISARGTVLAKQGKYKDAIPFYESALSLAHDHPSVLSNLALAHAMNGEPKRAETMLRQAAATDRNSLKIRQNLALVLGLQGKYDEAKLLASRDLSPENAAENTDYLRRVVRLEKKAPPTFQHHASPGESAAKDANHRAGRRGRNRDEGDTETDVQPEPAHAASAPWRSPRCRRASSCAARCCLRARREAEDAASRRKRRQASIRPSASPSGCRYPTPAAAESAAEDTAAVHQ